MTERVWLAALDDPAHGVETLRGRASVGGLLVVHLFRDAGQRALFRREISHGPQKVALALGEPLKDPYDVGDSLGAGGFPTDQNLRSRDDVAGPGVPGLLTGELEQERLASSAR